MSTKQIYPNKCNKQKQSVKSLNTSVVFVYAWNWTIVQRIGWRLESSKKFEYTYGYDDKWYQSSNSTKQNYHRKVTEKLLLFYLESGKLKNVKLSDMWFQKK